jgi:hypothetical protein
MGGVNQVGRDSRSQFNYMKRFYWDGSDGFRYHGCYLEDRDLAFYANGGVASYPNHDVTWIDEPPARAKRQA